MLAGAYVMWAKMENSMEFDGSILYTGWVGRSSTNEVTEDMDKNNIDRKCEDLYLLKMQSLAVDDVTV